MLLTLQGFWTVALYFGLLGVIWLPRYYVIPTPIRLWPTYWFYNTLANNLALPTFSVPPSVYTKKVYTSRNYTFNVDYKDQCFTCQLTIQPKYCSTLIYSDILFDSIHTADQYDVYTYENYPCYQTLSRSGQCLIHDTSNLVFSGTGCTLCSLCHKNTMFNTSERSQYRKYSYTPRFSLSLGNPRPPGVSHILHCLNKLVLIRYYTKAQFCAELQQHVSVYKQDKTTVVTGCSSFCSDSSKLVYRELYNTEIGVYLILLAAIVMSVLGLVTAAGYVLSLYNELGILNLAWNSTLTCPICMDKLYRFTRISTLHCGHMFCRACLHRWLYVFCHVTCPLCRQPVDPDAPRILATADTSPPVLMLSDTAHSEGDEDELSTTSEQSNSLMQSIYNIGRNVVAGWTSSRVEGAGDPLLGDVMQPAQMEESTDLTSDLSQPIPLPYYPLYTTPYITTTLQLPATNPAFNSIIVPYRRPMFDRNSLYDSYLPPNCNPGNLPHYHSNHQHPGNSNPANYHDFSFSDSDLPASSSSTDCRLQNRIVRKINRLRNRRLGVRRSQSTSDITSLTSDSEMDVF